MWPCGGHVALRTLLDGSVVVQGATPARPHPLSLAHGSASGLAWTARSARPAMLPGPGDAAPVRGPGRRKTRKCGTNLLRSKAQTRMNTEKMPFGAPSLGWHSILKAILEYPESGAKTARRTYFQPTPNLTLAPRRGHC